MAAVAKPHKKSAAHRKKGGYDADAIEWLQGLDAIRKKPTLYLPDTGSVGVNHLVKELVSNAADEAINGHAKTISVTINKGGQIVVADDGRGVPVGPHPKDKTRDTMELVFTEVHTGSKISNSDSYSSSIGTFGVGLAVVNAMSRQTIVWSYRNKHWNMLCFNDGVVAQRGGKPEFTKPPKAAAAKTRGTVVAIQPDLKLFNKGAKLDTAALLAWIDDLAWLTPATFKIADLTGPKPIHHTIAARNLKERFKADLDAFKAEPLTEGKDDVFVYRDKSVDLMIGWSTYADPSVKTYVAGSATIHNGTHYDGFIAGLKTVFGQLRKRGDKFTMASVLSGLVGVINVRVPNPVFVGQAKNELAGDAPKELVKAAVETHLLLWLKKRKALLRAVTARANDLTKLTATFNADRKLAAATRTTSRGKSLMPEKLLQATTSRPEERELIIVEGESALGTARRARDPKYQEVLPLTGKIPNLWRSSNADKLHTNKSLVDLLMSIGYEAGNPDASRTGKIIILTDADVDGEHLSALLLGLLQKVAPKMIADGKVFTVDAPLYIYRTKDTYLQGPSLQAIQKQVGTGFDHNKVQRAKGWGEVRADLLRDVAFNPGTRKLRKIKPPEGRKDIDRLVGMLGEDAAVRRELLGV